MPDLSHKGVHQFWHSYNDPIIYKVISFMESKEDWTLDGDPELEAAINKLGEILENVGRVDLQNQESFVELCAHIKTGRGLRILMALDQAYPGAAAKVLMNAEKATKSQKDLPGVFLRRNVVFERLRLLGRVFGADRFKIVTSALEETGYE